jgi:hypothetical protein
MGQKTKTKQKNPKNPHVLFFFQNGEVGMYTMDIFLEVMFPCGTI